MHVLLDVVWISQYGSEDGFNMLFGRHVVDTHELFRVAV